MKVLKFSFLFYSFFFCLGIAFYSSIPIYIAVFIVIVCLIFVGITSSSHSKIKSNRGVFYFHSFLLSVLFLFSGSLVRSFYDYKRDKIGYQHYLKTNEELAISFIVEEELKPSKYKRFYGRVSAINDESIDSRILLIFTDSLFHPEIGSQSYYKGKLSDISGPKNEGDFDYKKYLYINGIEGQIFVEECLKIGERKGYYYNLLRLRYRLINKVKSLPILSNDAKGLVLAILLGDRTYLSDEVVQDFKNLGIMHILAISGLHIGILYLLLNFLLAFLSRKYRTYLIIILLWIFVFLSGFSPSVYRAVFMFTLISISFLVKRKSSLENNLGIAIFVSLFFEPLLLYNVSFQLSYLAVLSIMCFLPYFRKYRSRNVVVSYIQDIVFVSLVVQIGLLPIQVYYFGQLSLSFLLGNLISIPLATIILFLAVFVVLFSFLSSWVGALLEHVLNSVVSFFYTLVNKFSFLDFLLIDGIKLSTIQLYVLLLSCLLVYIGMKYNKKIIVIAIFICINGLFIEYYYKSNRNNNRNDLIIPYTRKGENIRIEYYFKDSKEVYYIDNGDKEEYNNIIPDLFPISDRKLLFLNEHTPHYLIDDEIDFIVISGKVLINYDRLLSFYTPKEVVIHNSTPFWIKDQIKSVCEKVKIPFHDIHERGFWKLPLK